MSETKRDGDPPSNDEGCRRSPIDLFSPEAPLTNSSFRAAAIGGDIEPAKPIPIVCSQRFGVPGTMNDVVLQYDCCQNEATTSEDAGAGRYFNSAWTFPRLRPTR